MRPGEVIPADAPIEIHAGRERTNVVVHNTSQWTVHIASHVHFFEVNRKLLFDRRVAFGMHLDIAAGRAVRWEPGEEKPVDLVAFGGRRALYGFNGLCDGPATADRLDDAMDRARERGFLGGAEGQTG
jgi:urease beta subunit